MPDEPPPHPLPIDGTLDLHTFRPSDIGGLIPDYLEECHRAGLSTVRIVHGKGTGSLREGVHRILERCDRVERFSLCPGHEGGWGATRVWIKKQVGHSCPAPDAQANTTSFSKG